MAWLRAALWAMVLWIGLLPGAPVAQEAESDSSFLSRMIESSLSTDGQRVQVNGFSGALSSTATIQSVTIADDTGIWLRAEGLRMNWNRAALIRGRLEIQELSAERISVERAPVSQATGPAPEATPFALPVLPVSVNIGELRIDRIDLGEALIGKPVALTLQGNVVLAGGTGSASVTAARVDGPRGDFVLIGAFSNQTRVLSVDLKLDEDPGGLFATLLNLPGKPSVFAEVAGTGPIDSYKATLLVRTDGAVRVTGQAGLTRVGGPAGAPPTLDFTLNVRGDLTTLVAPEYRDFFGPEVRLDVAGTRAANGLINLSSFEVKAQAVDLSGSAEVTGAGWPRSIVLTGALGTADGRPVLLPGTNVTVRSSSVDVSFDVTQDSQWTALFGVTDLTVPGVVTVPTFALTGAGTIVPRLGDVPGQFTGTMGYQASGLVFEDPALAKAVGPSAGGEFRLSRTGEDPFRIIRATLTGPGIDLEAEGTIAGPEAGFLTQSSVILRADDMARFALLAGMDLGGSAGLVIVSSIRPLDRMFDATLTGDTQDLALGIAPLDPLLTGAGKVTISAARDEDGARINGFTIETPAVAATGAVNLTSAASDAAFDLRVTDVGLSLPGLSGPGAVKGTATLDEAGLTTVNATADLPGTQATLSATMPKGGEITGSVMADVGDLAPFGVIVGMPLAGSVEAVVSGSLAPDASTFDVTVIGRTADVAIGTPEVDALLAGVGRIDGRAIRTGPLSLRVEGLEIETPAITATGTVAVTDGKGDADLVVTMADVAAVLPGLSGPADITAKVSREADGSGLLDANAVLPGTTARVSARMASEADGGAITASVVAEAADLAPFSGLAGMELSGSVEALVSGTVQADLSLFDVTVMGRTQDVAIGMPEVDALLAGAGQIDGRVMRTGPQSLKVEGLRVQTAAVSGTGAVSVVDGVGDANLTVTLADVGPLLPGLTGPATVAGTATSDVAGLVMLDLTATGPGIDGAVKGTLTLPAQGLAFDGDVSARVADLTPFAGLAGMPLAGAVDLAASGRLQADLDQFDLKLTGQTQDVVIGNPTVDAIMAGTGTIDADLSRARPGDLQIRDFRFVTPVVTADVSAALTDGAGQAQVDVRIPDIAPLAPGYRGPARLSGTVAPNPAGGYVVNLDVAGPNTTATVGAVVFGADKGYQTDLNVTANVASIAMMSQLVGQPLGGSLNGQISGSVYPQQNTFDLTVNAQSTNLNPGVPVAATLLRGNGTVTGRVSLTNDKRLLVDGLEIRYPNFSVSADVSSDGTYGEARFDARLTDVGLIAPEFRGPATLSGTATLNDYAWQVQMNGTGPGGTTATVRGTAAKGLQTVDLAVNGSVPLGLINGAIEPNRIDGNATFDMRVQGPPTLNSVSGTIRVAGARVALPSLRFALPGLGGTVQIARGSATVNMSSGVEGGGRIAATGTVGLSGGFPANLRINADAVSIRDATLYETTATGVISITGPLMGGAVIAGNIDLGPVELRVPSSGVGVLGDLPEVHHIRPSVPVVVTLERAGLTAEGVPPGGAAGGSGAVYRLDVTVRAINRVFIRGRGLDAELGGQIRVQGTTAVPIPSGGFELIRGRLSILSQRFDLTEGSITLQGDLVPVIRFGAQTTARTGTLINILIDGRATAPEVTFSSIPDLPQDQVLAQLIFGTDLSQISPLQAIQLASAVASLAGRGGVGVVDGIRQTSGLDDFDIITDENGDAALSLGRYITEDIYTNVVVGSTESEINLNFDVTNDLTVKGTVTSNGETVLGIYFEKDY